jgi:hypothetical protein
MKIVDAPPPPPPPPPPGAAAAETRTLSDKWTVVTLDGKPSAHAEHTLAVTADGPEVLTLTKEQKRLRQSGNAETAVA